MKIYCKECLLPLTNDVMEYTGKVNADTQDGAPYIQKGYYKVCDGTWGYAVFSFGLCEGEMGKIVINPEDLIRSRNHKDKSRLSGCCAPAGLDGPNKICRNGHEVATLHADCWQPAAIVFINEAIITK
jgi:hypothetical protein